MRVANQVGQFPFDMERRGFGRELRWRVVISACIQHWMTAYEVSLIQEGTQPVLCASPIAYQIVNAAEGAVTKLKQAIKMTVLARNSVLQSGRFRPRANSFCFANVKYH